MFWQNFQTPCVFLEREFFGPFSLVFPSNCPLSKNQQYLYIQCVVICTSAGVKIGCMTEVSLTDYFLARRVTNEQKVVGREEQKDVGKEAETHG